LSKNLVGFFGVVLMLKLTSLKVAWDKLCFPKKEGGLMIKKLEVWNQASLLNHIWILFTKAGSLWVA
jgi:hypothetical protein